jgi:hypothetical protein
MGGDTAICLLRIAILDVRGDILEKGNVFIRMKPRHFLPCRRLRNLTPPQQTDYYTRSFWRHGRDTYAHVEFPVDVVVDDEVVHHPHAMGFHGVLSFACEQSATRSFPVCGGDGCCLSTGNCRHRGGKSS